MCAFAGADVDCSTKQAAPRTFSTISTFTSPSLKVPTSGTEPSKAEIQQRLHQNLFTLRKLYLINQADSERLLHGTLVNAVRRPQVPRVRRGVRRFGLLYAATIPARSPGGRLPVRRA